ncbi:tetratricopeptide repeat protein [Sulfurospirillum sp. 1612]|uniref:tetratricopeptide repeat protein n=1 Tax=Sulfurospirillum sp. 1612 TaxID=3094835 RepID=UPI002F949F7F
MSMNLSLGIDYFYKGDFEKALFYFALALQEDQDSVAARVGAILSDMATQRRHEAEALFEYFMLTKDSENGDIVEEIVDLADASIESIFEKIDSKELEHAMNEENGIEYVDFIKLVAQRGSFKKAFEDIMFSTKVLISNKDDFVDFLEQLIDSGFTEMSINYLESAISMYPNDTKLISLVEKAIKF